MHNIKLLDLEITVFLFTVSSICGAMIPLLWCSNAANLRAYLSLIGFVQYLGRKLQMGEKPEGLLLYIHFLQGNAVIRCKVG